MSVRRLRSQIYGQLLRCLVEIGNATAGFERRGMAPLRDGVHGGLDRRILKSLVGGGFVAHLPMKNMIGLLLAVFAQDRRIRVGGLVRIDQHG